jgi:hypothetical protein
MPQLDFLAQDYEQQLPMYRWGDWADLESKIRFYLTDGKANQGVRDKTQAIVASRHTYMHRVQELLWQVGLA